MVRSEHTADVSTAWSKKCSLTGDLGMPGSSSCLTLVQGVRYICSRSSASVPSLRGYFPADCIVAVGGPDICGDEIYETMEIVCSIVSLAFVYSEGLFNRQRHLFTYTIYSCAISQTHI